MKISFIFFLLITIQFSAMSQSKFDGTFENKQYELQISVKKENVAYAVQFVFRGKYYKGTATDFLGYITGTYDFDGRAIQFSFSKILGQFYFTSEGTDVPLSKIAETAQQLKGSKPNTISNSTASNIPTTTLEKQWWQRLKGKRLLYLYTGNGYSEKWHYDLCSDGTYAYADDASYTSGGNFSAITANNATGTWRIVSKGNAVFLLLISNQNGNREFTLSNKQASNEVALNNKRYFLTTNERCR